MQDHTHYACSLEEVMGQSSEDYFRAVFGMDDIVLQEQVSSTQTNSSEQNEHPEVVDYRRKYVELKKKLKDLINDNALFRHQLLVNERELLKVTRDRSFLLDRLLAYEPPEDSPTSSSSGSRSDTPTDENSPLAEHKPSASEKKRCKNVSNKKQLAKKMKRNGNC